MNAQDVISILGLRPHPEGGYFNETHRSEERYSAEVLPGRYGSSRATSTAIYFLLTPDTFSEMHRLRSDEVFHHYIGDPVEMLRLGPDGTADVVVLGTGLASGMRPQVVVPRGVWQGSRLVPGGEYALLGCTVAPGFDYSDYESGSRDELSKTYPLFKEMIQALTRK